MYGCYCVHTSCRLFFIFRVMYSWHILLSVFLQVFKTNFCQKCPGSCQKLMINTCLWKSRLHGSSLQIFSLGGLCCLSLQVACKDIREQIVASRFNSLLGPLCPLWSIIGTVIVHCPGSCGCSTHDISCVDVSHKLFFACQTGNACPWPCCWGQGHCSLSHTIQLPLLSVITAMSLSNESYGTACYPRIALSLIICFTR